MDLERLDEALARAGDRWSLLILAVLLEAPATFSRLAEQVPGISPAVLSARLKALEADALVVATPYQDRPTRYRYEVTAAGGALRDALVALSAWGGAEVHHDVCGSSAVIAWWCPTCQVAIDPDTAGLHRL
jgi:DNA-binding HxlR family transcriptional regulator